MLRLGARLRALSLGLFLATTVCFVTTQLIDVEVAHAKRKKKKKKKKKKKRAATESTQQPAPDAKPDQSAACTGDDACGEGTVCVDGACVAPKREEVEALRKTGPAKLRLPVGDKDFDRSSKADKKRDAVIADIKKILPTMKGPQKAELVFRLAEMYWEKSKFIESLEWAAFEKDVQLWVDGGMKSREPKPGEYNRESVVYKKQALANYGIILENYKEYPRRDEVLYIMAYNQYEAGKSKEAMRNYWELIKQYPQSQFIGDAYLAMGDHYFNANSVIKSRKAYLEALKTKKPKIYSYALYKLAWCDYNLQEFEAAIDKFKKVIDYAERQGGKQDGDARDHVQLKSEALNDITLTFSHVDAVDTAYEYIRTKGGEKLARSLTEKLARTYHEEGKFDQEIMTYRLLINTYPDDATCPDFQSSVVAAFSKLGKREEVRTEVRRLVELYREGSPWWKRNEGNKAALIRAQDTAENRMRELVTDYHQYCQKYTKREDCSLSKDIYAEYLQAFETSEHAYRMRFFYAEVLWDLGYYKMAGEQYDKVVELDAKGEYSRVAAFNSVLTWEKIVAGIEKDETKKLQGVDDKKAKKRDPSRKTTIKLEKDYKKAAERGKSFDTQPIPENEVRLAAACDRYVGIVPKKAARDKEVLEELVAVKFKAGAIYQKYYHFKEAATRFGELIERWPTHKLARAGADLILDSFDARQDWTELNRWSRKFQKNKALMADGKFAALVDKYVEGSSFKEIMAVYAKANKLLEQKQDDEARPLFADAAERFAAFQKEFPESGFAPTAMFNATVIYDRAQKLDLAIAAAELLLKQYDNELDKEANKKNNLKQKALLFLASFYEQIADFAKAAEYYESFVDKYKDEEKAPDAIYNAGILYLGLGDSKRAIAAFGKYIKDYNKEKDVPQVYWKIANIYVDQGDWRRAATLFGEFEKRFKEAEVDIRFESRYRFVENLMRDGRRKDAVKICQSMLEQYAKMPDKAKQSPAVQEGAGRCAFELMEPEFQTFDAIKLTLPMKNLRKQLTDKLEQAPVLAKRYTELLGYGNGEWGVAGLVRGALCFKSLVDALFEAPDPPGLTMDQLEIYRAELENEAFKYEDQAIHGLEIALKKAFELGIYSDWTLRGEEALKKYKPNQFPDIREMAFYPSESFRAATVAN